MNECFVQGKLRADRGPRIPIAGSARTRRGSIFLATIIATFFVCTLGVVLAQVAASDLKAASSDTGAEQALNAADAGIDYAVAEMSNGVTNPAAGPYTLPGSGATFTLSCGPADSRYGSGAVQITSVGSKSSARASVTVKAVATSGETDGVWTNSLFSGDKSQFTLQNTVVEGSINIQGGGAASGGATLSPTQTAWVVQSSSVRNNYNAIPTSITALLPPLPTAQVGGTTVSTVQAKVRIKNGRLLPQISTFGQASANAGSKAALDGVYMSTPSASITTYSDAGDGPTYPAYDLSSSVGFPYLSTNPFLYTDPSSGQQYSFSDYYAFLAGSINGYPNSYQYTGGNLVIQSPTFTNGLQIGDPPPYSVGDHKNGVLFSMVSGQPTMQIHGMVWIKNGNLTVQASQMYYVGSGTLAVKGSVTSPNAGESGVSAGSITIQGSVIPQGTYATGGGYCNPTPTSGIPNSLGLVAGTIVIQAGVQSFCAAAFAEDSLTSQATNSVGALVFGHGTVQSDNVAYVPDLVNSMPPGMPGAGSGSSGGAYSVSDYVEMPAGT